MVAAGALRVPVGGFVAQRPDDVRQGVDQPSGRAACHSCGGGGDLALHAASRWPPCPFLASLVILLLLTCTCTRAGMQLGMQARWHAGRHGALLPLLLRLPRCLPARRARPNSIVLWLHEQHRLRRQVQFGQGLPQALCSRRVGRRGAQAGCGTHGRQSRRAGGGARAGAKGWQAGSMGRQHRQPRQPLESSQCRRAVATPAGCPSPTYLLRRRGEGRWWRGSSAAQTQLPGNPQNRRQPATRAAIHQSMHRSKQ